MVKPLYRYTDAQLQEEMERRQDAEALTQQRAWFKQEVVKISNRTQIYCKDYWSLYMSESFKSLMACYLIALGLQAACEGQTLHKLLK